MGNDITPEITVNFSKKIETTTFDAMSLSKNPMDTIYRHKEKANTFTVNVFMFIPQNLIPISNSNKNPTKTYVSLIDDVIYLTYTTNLFTDFKLNGTLPKGDTDLTNCLDFTIEFDSRDIKHCDAYYFQFDLTLEEKYYNEVLGIIMNTKNDDPITRRGTVTTVRDRGN